MSRRSKGRRRRERQTEHAAAKLVEPTVVRPVKMERLRQIYTCMRGRNFNVGFLPIGPLVDADNPEDMMRKIDAILIAEASKQKPS